MPDNEHELVMGRLKRLRRQVGNEGIGLSNKAIYWTIVIIYGLFVMVFLLGGLWNEKRFGC